MFTGIIYHKGKVLEIEPRGNTVRFVITNPFDPEDPPKHGDSIATNGCCLTVVDVTEKTLSFDAIPETLAKTNLGHLKIGDVVHYERSLRFGDRVDGHIVQGHVDCRATVVSVKTDGEWRVTIRVPHELSKYLVPKGSVAVDGVSLTLARVEGAEFDVTLIPTTLELTTLGQWKPGYELNLECDATVKTIVAAIERMNLAKS